MLYILAQKIAAWVLAVLRLAWYMRLRLGGWMRAGMTHDSLFAPSFLANSTYVVPHSAAASAVHMAWDVWRPVFIINDVATAEQFYITHDKHTRTPSFSMLGAVCETFLGAAVGTQHGHRWSWQRAQLGHEFKRGVRGRGPDTRFAEMNALVGRWVADFDYATLNRLTIDCLARVVYGLSDTDAHHRAALHKLAARHERLMPWMRSMRARVPWVGKWLVPDLRQFAHDWHMFNCIMAHRARRDSLLFRLIDDHKLSRTEIDANLNEILLFNIDVMYAAIAALAVALADCSQDVRRARREVLAAGDPAEWTHATLLSCQCVRALMLRTAHRCPSLAYTFPENAEAGSSIAPAGVPVLVNAARINRASYLHCGGTLDAYIGGAMPKFHRFGLGPRRCLGYMYADMILMLFIAHVVWRGDMQLDDEADNGAHMPSLPFFTPNALPATHIRPFNLTFRVVRPLRRAALCGISLGNGYYNRANVYTLLREMSVIFDDVYVFIPGPPYEHTYRAQMRDETKIHAKIKKDEVFLHKIVDAAIKEYNLPNIHNTWWKDADTQLLDASLTYVEALYNKDKTFRDDVLATTQPVVRAGMEEEGARFLLKELAYLRVAHAIHYAEVTYVYHNEWPILEHLIDGVYDDNPVPIGFMLASPATKS